MPVDSLYIYRAPVLNFTANTLLAELQSQNKACLNAYITQIDIG